jgi:hypothetical protein
MKHRNAHLKYGIWQEKKRRTALPIAAGILIAVLIGALSGYLIGRI